MNNTESNKRLSTLSVTKPLLLVVMVGTLLMGCKATIPFMPHNIDRFLDGEDYDESQAGPEKTRKADTELAIEIRKKSDKPEDSKTASVTEPEAVIEEPLPRCHPSRNPQYAYRKRIALLPMELANPQETVDLPAIERQYPRALLQRLNADRLITVNATQTQLTRTKDRTQSTSAVMPATQVKALAKDLNAQFIISGKLLDLSFKQAHIKPLGLLTGINGWKDMGNAIHQQHKGLYERQFAAELNLFDGASGTLIESKQFRTSGEQSIRLGAYNLNSNAFWSSKYGMRVSWLLDQQAKMVEDALACLPLRGHITRITHDSIELDVGTEAFIIPGDKLQVFKHRKVGWTTDGKRSYQLQHLGAMTVTRAYPMGATGKLDKTSLLQELNPGDIVQAW